MSAGIGLILGLNGAIWVSTQQHQTTAVPSGAAAAHEGLAQQQQKQADMLTKEERSRIVRVATCIRALARLYLLVCPATILETFQVGRALISDDLDSFLVCSELTQHSQGLRLSSLEELQCVLT